MLYTGCFGLISDWPGMENVRIKILKQWLEEDMKKLIELATELGALEKEAEALKIQIQCAETLIKYAKARLAFAADERPGGEDG